MILKAQDRLSQARPKFVINFFIKEPKTNCENGRDERENIEAYIQWKHTFVRKQNRIKTTNKIIVIK